MGCLPEVSTHCTLKTPRRIAPPWASDDAVVMTAS
eukprot:CAMPEP_0182464588 /NCGR_PEP_ID=MMETSP1319-20130603/8727_1 /TAXON_ID=172717 /ORGANISM="Bolidomonas pacifica, Strain RCC208" /LENGTH=34 /DNA_ID= /DNA_START= /DNA_END= /DNA_ORIENTATION=